MGKRKPRTDWEAADRLLKLVVELRGNKPFVRRGVYRFASHVAAQEAMLAGYAAKPTKKARG